MTPPGEISVRLCQAADVSKITDLEPVGARYAEATFAAQEAGRCAYFVAWVDDTPAGSGELEWADPPELKNLQVARALRGRGIGSSIMRAAEEAAAGYGAISLGVGIDNPDARRLYERFGYTSTGRLETYSYDYVDAEGVCRSATETAEYLTKDLQRE